MVLHLLISAATPLINVIRDRQSIQIGSPIAAIINKLNFLLFLAILKQRMMQRPDLNWRIELSSQHKNIMSI